MIGKPKPAAVDPSNGSQPDLFEVGERNVNETRRRYAVCTPTPTGTGPTGKTCKTCEHCVRFHSGKKRWLKCGLVRRFWTHGTGTDILARWAACSKYEIAADDLERPTTDVRNWLAMRKLQKKLETTDK